MTKKGVDMIAANLVDKNGLGFNSDDNEVTVFWQNESHVLEKQAKEQLARKLVNFDIKSLSRKSLISSNGGFLE